MTTPCPSAHPSAYPYHTLPLTVWVMAIPCPLPPWARLTGTWPGPAPQDLAGDLAAFPALPRQRGASLEINKKSACDHEHPRPEAGSEIRVGEHACQGSDQDFVLPKARSHAKAFPHVLRNCLFEHKRVDCSCAVGQKKSTNAHARPRFGTQVRIPCALRRRQQRNRMNGKKTSERKPSRTIPMACPLPRRCAREGRADRRNEHANNR